MIALLKRLGFTFPLMLIISLSAFALMHSAPGGPFDKDRAPAAPEIKRALEARFHLDEPVWKQYLRYLGLLWERSAEGKWRRVEGGLFQGDLGPSMKYRNHSVTDIVAQALPVSLSLGLMAFCFATGLGIPLGCLTAARRGRWQEWAGSLCEWDSGYVSASVPGRCSEPLLRTGASSAPAVAGCSASWCNSTRQTPCSWKSPRNS